ncbi:glycosyltransferase family 4 protein [Hassallia byssoidea VB512170]|uniref:Glycosyltransferase family 4 protein n=1 Tax=Hassallia byssoidea VB512170 TaxID=1304833 RepID=A0A846H9U1_9CYAN|nr:glycosyltransferase family 1 protein [Hassalia byssoidea]NEU74132.1 glycosyltransferase family 4 protein [Hassalia byssoidea VB512170]
MNNSVVFNLSFISNEYTGIARYATEIIPYLQGLNPTILTPKAIDNYICYAVPPNLTPEDGTKGHFQRLLWTQFQLPRICQQLQYSLLFSPLPEAPLFSGCRYIVTAHDLIPLRFGKRFSRLTTYFRYYIPQVLKQAQHIICNSHATAKDITDFYQIPASKITPIPLAHDRNHFRFLNLPTRNYFLYIGRQDSYKNLQRLIAAFAALPNCQDYQLWLAGPTHQRYILVLQAQVQELGLTNQVKFLDYVPDNELPTIINQAIALVFPSLWEGFGFPVLEAMACGTPVITSNLSSLPEVAGDAAILINPYNIGEITEAMQTIATDSALRSRFSSQGIIQSQQFSWEKTGKATSQVLSRYL